MYWVTRSIFTFIFSIKWFYFYLELLKVSIKTHIYCTSFYGLKHRFEHFPICFHIFILKQYLYQLFYPNIILFLGPICVMLYFIFSKSYNFVYFKIILMHINCICNIYLFIYIYISQLNSFIPFPQHIPLNIYQSIISILIGLHWLDKWHVHI